MTVQHNKNNILTCLVGLPRSGKSTWARQQSVPIVNMDSVRYALYGQRYWGSGEQLVRVHASIMVRALFMAGHNHIILDECNTKREERGYWIHEGSRGEFVIWETEFKLFDLSPEDCKIRALDNRLRDAIDIMAKDLFTKDGKLKRKIEYL